MASKQSIEYGEVEYEEINRIFNSLKFECIYVKGEQKQKMIMEFILHITINNIEELGCPRLDKLCVKDNLPCCNFCMNLYPIKYTFHNIFALRKWFINNT